MSARCSGWADMELFLLLLIWGGCIAVSEGTKAGGRAVGKSYRKKVGAWSKGHPSKPTPLGTKVGAAAATAATGAGLAVAGFAKGVRVGWPEGRRRGREWHERRTTRGQDEPETAPEPATAEAPTETKTEAQPLRLVSNNDTSTAPDNGGKDMAVMTQTGGEVHTMQQLVAELEGIKKEASASLEDAQADAARAKEDAQRVEMMTASLSNLDLDQQTLSEVGALAEPAAQQQKAAQDRATAAEHRLALADTALQGVQKRHSLMQEAHAATPHAADKQFYTG